MIKSLKLTNFRKFTDLEIDLNHKTIILAGANAVGKTSILEAIYLISTSKSHRTNEIENLITHTKEYASIELKEQKEYKTILHSLGKTNYINEVKYEKISDFIGNLNVILYSPLDIELIQGSKAVRRRFLDLEVSLLDKPYLRLISAYKKLIKERNELLKEYSSQNKMLLDVLTNQIIELIEQLYEKRINFINHLNLKLNYVTNKLNCESILLEYIPTYDIKNLKKSFEHKLNYDVISKTTNIGIHRDDFMIYIQKVKAIEYASEGQMRTICLAIKLAILEIYKEKNKNVILLLDDVFASIDQRRMNAIMEYIKGEYQTILTTTSLFNIPDELIKNAVIIKL